jgi:hypothetical protein
MFKLLFIVGAKFDFKFDLTCDPSMIHVNSKYNLYVL